MRTCFYLSLIMVSVIGLSCSGERINSYHNYLAWLNDVEHGCKISKQVNDLVISVKYLPPDFLALKESELSGQAGKFDSLYYTYSHSFTFLMSFKTVQGQEGEDVMYKDISNFKEYVERSMELNFDLESKVFLTTKHEQSAPVLSSLENTYGLSKGRNVYFVFSSKDKDLFKNGYLDFVYNDDIYNTGILHFTFNMDKIQNILPQVTLKHS